MYYNKFNFSCNLGIILLYMKLHNVLNQAYWRRAVYCVVFSTLSRSPSVSIAYVHFNSHMHKFGSERSSGVTRGTGEGVDRPG